jgi:hypothetical protein
MAPCYVVRVSVSSGFGPDKEAEKPLLIRLSWVRPPHIPPYKPEKQRSPISFLIGLFYFSRTAVLRA